ncbi:MAG: hypothetical protein LBH28_09710 [Oscillospiraceae bacterium]|jgi:hypothetical protein|nr:hypothetical protein [Oscillospiraceae bacterium]
MDRFLIDKQVSPKDELTFLLDRNGVEYSVDADGVRFILEDNVCKWETVCRYTRSAVLIYGLYPFETGDDEATLRLLNSINGDLASGSMFLSKGRVVMRTSADLYDSYGAYEAIARAIEYNAGAIVKFWQTIRFSHTKHLSYCE